LAHHAGAPFARWLLEELTGAPCSAHDDWRADVTMLRYDDAVFRG
jgi:carbamoyl-phosphate synthase large subunit